MKSFCYDYKVMIVAEKPSISKAIAGYLQDQTYNSDLQDYHEKHTCVQKVYGKFRGKPTKFIVTSTKGHLYDHEFKDRRRDINPEEYFEMDISKFPINRKLNNLLNDYAYDSDYLILWLDNDDEGENICFEVIETVRNRLRKGYQIIRTQIQSVDRVSIGNALKEAEAYSRQPNEFQSLAVEAKHILDLRIGIAFTQMQTQYCRQSGVAFQSKYVSYGPCQIPTLYLVAERDMEIDSYKKNPKYQISCYVKVNTVEYKAVINKAIDTKEDAKVIFDEVSQSSEYKQLILKPLNTIEYLKQCSEQFNIGGEKALKIAQYLYSKSYITYPRTENDEYSENTKIEYDKLLNFAEGVSREMIREAKGRRIPIHLISRVIKDHDPIIPTGVVPDPNNPSLSKLDLEIYWFIVRHTMATIFLNIKRHNYKINIIHMKSSRQFTMLGQHQESYKYDEQFPQLRIQQQRISTILFNDNTIFESTKIEMEKVPPPMLISESELLTSMERYGIGTDASQASHIQKIITRGYVEVNKNRTLFTTKLGMNIITGYLKVDAELVKPTLRGNMEKETKKIATREAQYSQVIKQQLQIFKARFRIAQNNLDKIFGTPYVERQI